MISWIDYITSEFHKFEPRLRARGSKVKTAFVTPDGHYVVFLYLANVKTSPHPRRGFYEFMRMLFGKDTECPIVFQALMRAAVEGAVREAMQNSTQLVQTASHNALQNTSNTRLAPTGATLRPRDENTANDRCAADETRQPRRCPWLELPFDDSLRPNKTQRRRSYLVPRTCHHTTSMERVEIRARASSFLWGQLPAPF